MNPQRRLDPFALPPTTLSRFLLLVAIAVGAGAAGADQFAGTGQIWQWRYVMCAVNADRPAGIPAPEVHVAGFLACYRGVSANRLLVGLGGALLVILILAVCYAVYPHFAARRLGAIPLPMDSYPRAAEQIRTVLAPADRWRLLLAPFEESPAGRVFGHRRRPYLRLSRGLVHENAEPEPLRAVLRHELAHWTNRDLAISQLTVLSAWPLTLLAVILCVRIGAWLGTASWPLLWRWAAVLALLLAVRASIIRVREHYADVRAAEANVAAGDAPFLPAAFPDRRRRWNPWSYHPPTSLRAEVVHAKDPLFAAGFGEALATGLTVGILWGYATVLVSTITAIDRFHTDKVTALLITPLIVGVVGTGLWRAALHADIREIPRPTGTAAGLGLGSGLLTGLLIAPSQTSHWLRVLVGGHDPVMVAVSGLILILGCLLFTRWYAATAHAWGLRRRWVVHVVAVLALAVGLANWNGMTIVLATRAPVFDTLYSLFYFMYQPEAWIPIVAAALLPLVAGGARSRLALGFVTGGALAGLIEAALPGLFLRPVFDLIHVLSPLSYRDSVSAFIAVVALVVAASTWRDHAPVALPAAITTTWLMMAGVALGEDTVLFTLGAEAGECVVYSLLAVLLVAVVAGVWCPRRTSPGRRAPSRWFGAGFAALLLLAAAFSAAATVVPPQGPGPDLLEYARTVQPGPAVSFQQACADWQDSINRASLSTEEFAQRRLLLAAELTRSDSITLRALGLTLTTNVIENDTAGADEAVTATDYFCADVFLLYPR